MSQDSVVPRPVMLVILDGWGLSDREEGNAVRLGHTPTFDRIWSQCPKTQLAASGGDVGLQTGVMGNSEVGHLNIGAGRIVWQDSLLIDQTIGDGSFFENETLLAAIHHAKTHSTRLHLMGLISNGSVHSSETHYLALLRMAAQHGLRGEQVLLHAFTDGRDTAPHGGKGFLSRVLAEMAQTGTGAIASVIGRYWAMDRDKRWTRVQLAYECLTQGKGHVAPDAITAVTSAYERGETDEFIGATVVCDATGNPRPRIEENDAVIFFNYRSDRGRELTQLFLDDNFDRDLPPASTYSPEERERAHFARAVRPKVHYVTMTRYDSALACPIAFEPREQRDGLGETVAKAGKTQLRMAETEKYPHVTYFFSGGVEIPWAGEERILAPSPQVATYDLQPQMSAEELTEKAVAAIESQHFDLVILNFANPDMVGHTGVLSAAIKAVETADAGLGQILDALEKVGGACLVIADHGNCEQMIDPKTGGPHTAHTTNPVPCVLVGEHFQNAKLRSGGRLADVAPTLLGLMQIAQPPAMTGIDLRKTAPDQLVGFVADTSSSAAQIAQAAQIQLLELFRVYSALCQIAPRQHAALCDAMAAETQAQSARLNEQAGSEEISQYDGALGFRELLAAATDGEIRLAQTLSENAEFSDALTSCQSRTDTLESW